MQIFHRYFFIWYKNSNMLNIYELAHFCNNNTVYHFRIFDILFLTTYLYTFSLYENPSFIIFSSETEYISTRSWYRNINFLPEPLNRNESGRFGALNSDSAHHFFRNACTKSGSLRFSQFSGCWLILSVYIIMSTHWQKNILDIFWLIYLYTFSLYENASLIILSSETEYMSTRSWYRNINFLRDRIRRIFL
jgi:hypothetical protein